MNSFDSMLLCNDITSCYGTEQNRTREQQHSRYMFDSNKSKAAAWQISFGTNTMELHI